MAPVVNDHPDIEALIRENYWMLAPALTMKLAFEIWQDHAEEWAVRVLWSRPLG